MNTIATNVNTARIRVYSPQGFQLYVELAYTTPEALMEETARIASAGFHPSPPTLEPGAEAEPITAVVRREKSDGTPIIDFYPAWNSAGTFGAHKYAHMYLDTGEEIAQFESASGLKLSDLPIYDGQQAIKRTFGRENKYETPVKRDFSIQRIPDGEWGSGMPKYKYDYVNAIPQPKAQRRPSDNPLKAHASKSTGAWWQNADNNNALAEKWRDATGFEGDNKSAFANMTAFALSDPGHFESGRDFYTTALNAWEAGQEEGAPEQTRMMIFNSTEQPNPYSE